MFDKKEWEKKYRENNRDKINDRQRKWRKQNIELVRRKRREYEARYREEHPEWVEKLRIREQSLKYKDVKRNAAYLRQYGVTLDQYEAMLADQGGVCAICKRPPFSNKRLAVDHCHSTGDVRGLIHHTCNTAIGLLEDSVEMLQNALDYLKRFAKTEKASSKYQQDFEA